MPSNSRLNNDRLAELRDGFCGNLLLRRAMDGFDDARRSPTTA